MNYGDRIPAHLPTLNALRCLKRRKKSESCIDDNPIMAIILLKSDEPFRTIIRAIGYDPFYVQYYTPSQLNLYRSYCKQYSNPRVSIDATGALVRPLGLLSERHTAPIFLYQIGVHDGHSQFAVANALGNS